MGNFNPSSLYWAIKSGERTCDSGTPLDKTAAGAGTVAYGVRTVGAFGQEFNHYLGKRIIPWDFV